MVLSLRGAHAGSAAYGQHLGTLSKSKKDTLHKNRFYCTLRTPFFDHFCAGKNGHSFPKVPCHRQEPGSSKAPRDVDSNGGTGPEQV